MLSWLKILRPLNLLQAFLAVLLTTAFLGELNQTSTLALLILSVLAINGGGNVINDIFDMDIDRVNRPERPLPAGSMTVRAAWIYTVILFAVGVLFAGLISWSTFFIAGPLSITLLVAYSVRLKREPLIGNLLVSFMLGLAFIYVGAAFNHITTTLIMAALAFGFTLIREIVKDLEDMRGDQKSGAKTLPLVWGESATVNFSIFLIVVFVILDLLPFVLGPYTTIYLWLVLVGINLPLILCAFILWKYPGKKNYSRIQLFLKLNIFVGLAALYLGRST